MTYSYRIKVAEHLDAAWVWEWSDCATITREADGQTCINGPHIDQATLYAILRRVRDLGLTLLLVERIQYPQFGKDKLS